MQQAHAGRDATRWRPSDRVLALGNSWTAAALDRAALRRPVQAVTALAMALLMLLSLSAPALAGKPGGGSTSTLQECSALEGGATKTLDEIRQQMGAVHALNEYQLTGAGVGVAVIDTGINGVDGLDPAAKIIDGPDLSFDALDDSLRHRDLHGHGSAMASIVGADRGHYGDGMAKNAKLINVKVGAADGAVDVSQVIAAIDWVIANKDQGGMNIRVINLAYATDATQSYVLDPLSHAVENAWKNGIVVVAAGGNDGRGIHRLGNPATNPFIIAVGASDDNKVPSWSSTGDGVRNPDLVAPGAGVLSAAVPGSYLVDANPGAVCQDRRGNLAIRGNGTSQAAAVVAGAAALLIEQRPELTPDQVKHLLTSTATDLGRTATQQGRGLMNLPAALAAPTPGLLTAKQLHTPSTGLGSLDAARGSYYVGPEGDQLRGELTAFGGQWNPAVWAPASAAGKAWTEQEYLDANTWLGGTWSGATWSGATWSGATWSGATWSGATWSGATWSGATWSGATWSGATWSGATWSGATWSGATWSGATWSGATWA